MRCRECVRSLLLFFSSLSPVLSILSLFSLSLIIFHLSFFFLIFHTFSFSIFRFLSPYPSYPLPLYFFISSRPIICSVEYVTPTSSLVCLIACRLRSLLTSISFTTRYVFCLDPCPSISNLICLECQLNLLYT